MFQHKINFYCALRWRYVELRIITEYEQLNDPLLHSLFTGAGYSPYQYSEFAPMYRVVWTRRIVVPSVLDDDE